MNKRPFSILPSSGYKNSQFQIVSSVDDLQIDLVQNDEIYKSIVASSKNPTVILQLENVGEYIARAVLEGEIFEQRITVADALRLGSSTLKETFFFDNSSLSFFLMKDRLHIFDHERGTLLTENLLSPTQILHIDEVNYLFVTRIGKSGNEIANFGLYNTETYSIQGELLNKYQQIAVYPTNNILWVYNLHDECIHCFEILDKNGDAFTQLRIFTNFIKHELSGDKLKLFIHYNDYITAIRLADHFQYDVPKEDNNAVDNSGNVFYISEGQITCHNEIEEIHIEAEFKKLINLNQNEYVYVGQDLRTVQREETFNSVSDQIIKANLSNIPEGEKRFKCDISSILPASHTTTSHRLLSIKAGMFLHLRRTTKTLVGLDLMKHEDGWISTPKTQISTSYELRKLNTEGNGLQVLSSNSFYILSRTRDCLIARDAKQTRFYNGQESLTIDNSHSYYLLEEADYSYILVKEKDGYILWTMGDFEIPLLKNIKVYNLPYIREQGVIWYSGTSKNIHIENSYLAGFVLSHCTSLQIDEVQAQHSAYKDADDYVFRANYILSSNQLVVNPKSGVVMGSIIGSIVSTSPGLFKLLSQRDTNLYLLVHNSITGKYEETEINLDQNKFLESYLSPNGKHLVLKEETNQYLWYDIEKAETVKFLSGRFLAFSREGNLIIEEDARRSVRIYDPLTFADITPPNYQHFRFLSPDGALYAQVSNPQVRYVDNLSTKGLSSSEARQIELRYDIPMQLELSKSTNYSYYKSEKHRVDTNRRNYFEQNEVELRKLGIHNFHQITYERLVKTERFIEIGIVGTEVTAEILLPSDLDYYNYAAFSYDNRYFGYVGKPHSNGLIHLFRINYDSAQQKLSIAESYITRYPRYASWVCGFSRTGYFATYDSTPDTYIIKVTDHLFKSTSTDPFNRSSLQANKASISHSFKAWQEISGKNYLCFSPSGRFLAVSEQGYEPLTLGGYGHLESNAVHIAETESGKIVDSFTAHGASIKQDKVKKVTFVAFSEDESRVMTLSNDGVVVVREIEIL